MERTPLLIIGAGPTGLGAAIRCREFGQPFLLVEAAADPGGLASSVVDEAGFTWDLGSHLQFSHYERYDRLLDESLATDEWLHHRRSTWVWLHGRHIPFPLQHNLHRLPQKLRWECVRGLLQAQRGNGAVPGNFREWILKTFGNGIAETFLFPYNRKLWACDAAEMGHEWIADRVPEPDLETVLRGICLDEDQTGWGPNRTFRYPRRGGTGALWQAVAAELPTDLLRYGEPIVKIDADRGIAHSGSGKNFAYDHLISTIPLDRLVRLIGWDEGILASRQLLRTQTEIVGVGLEGPLPESLRGKCWIYFPEAEFPFYRVTILSNLSPENTPRPGRQWSLMAEIADPGDTSVPQANPTDDVIAAYRRLGWLNLRQSIKSRWRRRLSHGYPVPSLERDRWLDQLLPLLEEWGIFSRGRFGAWKYEVSNQDHSFMQGTEAVERIVTGAVELTLHQPDLVNSRHNPFPFVEWAQSADSLLQEVK